MYRRRWDWTVIPRIGRGTSGAQTDIDVDGTARRYPTRSATAPRCSALSPPPSYTKDNEIAPWRGRRSYREREPQSERGSSGVHVGIGEHIVRYPTPPDRPPLPTLRQTTLSVKTQTCAALILPSQSKRDHRSRITTTASVSTTLANHKCLTTFLYDNIAGSIRLRTV